MNCWTYLWSKEGWESKKQDVSFGEKYITYAVSDKFKLRRVESGDTLFICTVVGENFYLGGSLVIEKITNRSDAVTILKKDSAELSNDGSEFAIANLTKLSIFRPSRLVPVEVVDSLTFYGKKGTKTPLREDDGRLNVQTFRGIRQLVKGEEVKLSAYL